MIYLAKIVRIETNLDLQTTIILEINTMQAAMLKKVCTLISTFGILLTITSLALGAGDPVAGKEKATACAACHGTDGNSINPEFPKIAGQVPGYIATQLAAYQSGARQSAVMMGLILNLSEQDMQDIDAYYLQNEASKASISESDLAGARRGQEIYRRGLSQYSVPACMACHGPAGDGIPSRYPKVSGQFKEYLVKSLLQFKTGERKSEEMETISFRLTLQQIEDLAVYMQGLD